MISAERLLRLYPRAWRARYGEEFLSIVGDRALHVQQVIDIVSGAIDAWLSADVRTATAVGRLAPSGEGSMLKSLMICESTKLRFTTRDSLLSAAAMIGGTLIFSLVGIVLQREGWLVTGEILKGLAFPGSLMLSMPFWLMKGQPWKAQAAIVGISLALLTAAGYLATLI